MFANSMSAIAGPCLCQGLQGSLRLSGLEGSRRRARVAVAAEAGGGEDGEGRGGKGRGGSKGSAQLERWARARRIRSGRMGEGRKGESSVAEAVKVVKEAPVSMVPDYESDEEEDEVHGKGVYMISDGTGWTADHAVQAALGQFEHCLVDQRCSVNTYLFSQINEVDRLMEIIRQAAQEEALVFYTLADPHMAEAAQKACEMLHVPHINILGPITDALESHLGMSPSGIPRGAPGRKTALSKQYFKRIEAVEFTIRQDDGALPKNIINADIVLTGVSRTSKTPLSTYMAQKGYKVANVPLVLGIDPPKELFEVDQDKVFALTINPSYLKSIRIARALTLGMVGDGRTKYSDMEHIRKELDYSRQLFIENPRWPVVEVTGKAIEETAAVILRIYHERRSKHHMPRISRRY
ncbi:hypothetical protein KC19_8G175100 [Ceratodon purpureus]|uniref:Pyruvate, phosphate dikinase regulatory protein, chloroplastic n=1 Tax=Ceratodon purpureus TaxID=3225 RepID=A0A8T0H4H4_CERPU|nr:hypothetical protein KC19_8G175100 [Ceratodon purpureus]